MAFALPPPFRLKRFATIQVAYSSVTQMGNEAFQPKEKKSRCRDLTSR